MLNDQPVGLGEPEVKKGTRVLIVKSNYNGPNDELLAVFKAAKALLEHSKIEYKVIMVPGALEIPPVVAAMQRAGDRFDGYVALGAILPATHKKGEGEEKIEIENPQPTREQETNLPIVTDHLMHLAVAGACIGTGIISHTQDRTPEQWGENAVKACLHMIQIQQEEFGAKPVRVKRKRNSAAKRSAPRA